MRKTLIAAVLLAFTFCLISCNDDDEKNDITGEIIGKWEATQFMSLESRGYAKNDNYNPVIEFKADGTFDIQLDINHCFGGFEIRGESGIDIGGVGCTEACCDSDFSNKFVEMLPQVVSFDIEGDELRLYISDWGWIVLELIDR